MALDIDALRFEDQAAELVGARVPPQVKKAFPYVTWVRGLRSTLAARPSRWGEVSDEHAK